MPVWISQDRGIRSPNEFAVLDHEICCRPSLIIAQPGGDLRDRFRLQFHRDHRPLDVDDARLYAVEALEAVLFINLLMDLQALQKNGVDPFSCRRFQRLGYQAARDSGSSE